MHPALQPIVDAVYAADAAIAQSSTTTPAVPEDEQIKNFGNDQLTAEIKRRLANGDFGCFMGLLLAIFVERDANNVTLAEKSADKLDTMGLPPTMTDADIAEIQEAVTSMVDDMVDTEQNLLAIIRREMTEAGGGPR